MLRKLFNIPTKEQKIAIKKGCDKLIDMAKESSTKHWKDENKRQENHNQSCPNCGSKKIVNKIARVEGKGSVYGSFMLGGGSVYGSSSMDTNEVNNCNDCGNQWKKYNFNYQDHDDILVDWINDLGYVAQGKYSFGDKTPKLLEHIPAESIWKVANLKKE